MSKITEIKSAIRRLGVEAESISNNADLTIADKKSALAALDVKSADLKGQLEIVEKAASFGVAAEATEEATAPVATKSWAASLAEGFKKASEASTKFTFATEVKTAGTVTEGTALSNGLLNGSFGVAATPTYLPGIVEILYPKTGVINLFAQGTTESPLVSYVKQATATLGAAGVAEGSAFPQSDATIARVTETVSKIASYFKITNETLADVAQANSFLTNMLVKSLIRAEENAILNGTGSNSVTGILNRSGLQTAIAVTAASADPSKVVDALYSQVTVIRTTAFVEPDAIVMNPSDFSKIRLAKDKNGQYYAGGPFTGAYGNPAGDYTDSIFGLKVVQSSFIAAGTALVGAFAEGGQVFRRSGIVVEATNSNVDDFQNDLVTVRAESRMALAVYRPGAFGTVTIAWS